MTVEYYEANKLAVFDEYDGYSNLSSFEQVFSVVDQIFETGMNIAELAKTFMELKSAAESTGTNAAAGAVAGGIAGAIFSWLFGGSCGGTKYEPEEPAEEGTYLLIPSLDLPISDDSEPLPGNWKTQSIVNSQETYNSISKAYFPYYINDVARFNKACNDYKLSFSGYNSSEVAVYYQYILDAFLYEFNRLRMKNLEAIIGEKAEKEHTHDQYALKTDLDNIQLDDYALKEHTHAE